MLSCLAPLAAFVAALVLATPALAQEAPSSKQQLLQMINAVRIDRGRLPLADASELATAAQAHSADMVDNAYLDHTGSDGSEPIDRAARAGYRVPPGTGWLVVEVISAISADPSGPLNWWLGDRVHARVLLDPRWREVGVGYARGGPYGNYWTVLVGCRPGVVPTLVIDGTSYATSETCAPS